MLEALKPRETGLLAFAGLAAGILAGNGHPSPLRLALAFVAVTIGSAGCNGLTNYLDREMDGRMQRTRRRPIPSGRIQPAERILPLAGGLVLAGLLISLLLNPVAFAAGLAGVATALVARKRSITHVPLGEVSSCAPVLVGWLCVNPQVSTTLLWTCALVAVWTPIHVWSLMVAYRDDYLQAGIRIFPLRTSPRSTMRLLLALAVLLTAVSIALGVFGAMGPAYFAAAIPLNAALLLASARLVGSGASGGAWRVYKLSAYPYLGLIFCAACLDRWLSLMAGV